MVQRRQPAEAILAEKGIRAEVINIHTIKPLDVEAVLESVGKTGCAVTCEEHQVNGGLGDSIAQCTGRFHPTPIEMVAVKDSFGESGKPLDLLKKYGLSPADIAQAAEKAIARK